MGYLLTVDVLKFQVIIFLTIVAAGAMSRGKLWLVTAGWIAFTLFGSIFTAGLMLLQLATIAISYGIGSAATNGGTGTPQPPPTSKIEIAPPTIAPPTSQGIGLVGTLVIIAGALWVASIVFDSDKIEA